MIVDDRMEFYWLIFSGLLQVTTCYFGLGMTRFLALSLLPQYRSVSQGWFYSFLRLYDECCVTIFQPTPQDVEDVDISTEGMRIFHCRDLGDGIYID